jgi:hypothetical protein
VPLEAHLEIVVDADIQRVVSAPQDVAPGHETTMPSSSAWLKYLSAAGVVEGEALRLALNDDARSGQFSLKEAHSEQVELACQLKLVLQASRPTSARSATVGNFRLHS